MEDEPPNCVAMSPRQGAGHRGSKTEATQIERIDPQLSEQSINAPGHGVGGVPFGKRVGRGVAGEIRDDEGAPARQSTEAATKLLSGTEEAVTEYEGFAPAPHQIAKPPAPHLRIPFDKNTHAPILDYLCTPVECVLPGAMGLGSQ
jgi:hypothetical protein